MLSPTADRRKIYEKFFEDGVAIVKKDHNLESHPEIEGVKNLYVLKALESLVSRGCARAQFSWGQHYFYLTDEGTAYLREYLGLPKDVIPSTLKVSKTSETRQTFTDKDPCGESSFATMPNETYQPERTWLEPRTNENGETLRFAGLRPHGWNPHLAILYYGGTIDRAIESINALKSRGDLSNAFEELRILSRRAPRNLDVLRFCANFSKENNDNSMMEGYLRCILQLNPRDESVKKARFEILHSVDEEDNCLLSEIDALLARCKSRPASPNDFKNKKDFRARSIYNTTAIEGNTLSLTEVRTVIDTGAHVEGHSEKEHLEIKGMVDALNFVEERRKQGLSTETLTLEDILEIHKRVLLDKPEYGGKLREIPVHLRGVPFVPPAVRCVEEEMVKVLKVINNKPPKMHPVEFAALVHYAFVHVHPFPDGNGRVSRILMDIALEDGGFPPLIVQYANRTAYYHSLYFGHMGDLRQFIRYIAQLMKQRLWIYAEKGNYTRVPDDEPCQLVITDEAMDADETMD